MLMIDRDAAVMSDQAIELITERVTRSTVYTHWREWGGYKLGKASTAAIRFDGEARRRDLLVDAPRFADPLGAIT